MDVTVCAQHHALQAYYQGGTSRERRQANNDAMRAIEVQEVTWPQVHGQSLVAPPVGTLLADVVRVAPWMYATGGFNKGDVRVHVI